MSPLPLILLLAVMGLTGCSRDPSLEISGSFFPAWMISILGGLLGTLLAARLFAALGIEAYLKPPLLIYGCLALSLTLALWLILYF
jgi:hypothetical protein